MKHPSLMQEARNNPALTVGEVGRLLNVDPKTVGRWCNEGKMKSFRTPGGHRRILLSEVTRIREGR